MTILIPAYEPDKRMIALLERLTATVKWHIVIVDDGSGAEYGKIFEQAKTLGCTVVYHPHNMGKGAALKTGFKFIREMGETQGVVCADCDGQHLNEDIIAVAEKAISNKGAMVLGSRQFTGHVPARSRLGNTVTRYIFALSTGNKVYDTQTGLRAYTSDMLPYLETVAGERFEYEMNLLIYAGRDGYDIVELPIQTVYPENSKDHISHFDTFRDSTLVFKSILKYSMSSFIAFLLDNAVFFLMMGLTGIFALSYVTARIISAGTNYLINRHVVFKEGSKNSFLKYAALALFVFACGFGLSWLLIEKLQMPTVVKPIVDILLTAVSYLGQRLFVFKRKR